MEGRFFKDKLSVLGNVGIGTTSSRGPLEVHAASDSTLIIERFTSNGIQLRADNSVNSAIRLGFEAYTYEFKNGSGASRLHIDANGNVGIGTASPSQKLHVVGKALITDDLQLTGSNPRIDFNTNGASSLRFYDTTNAAERMRINTSGNLGINTTSPTSKLQIVGSTSGDSVL